MLSPIQEFYKIFKIPCLNLLSRCQKYNYILDIFSFAHYIVSDYMISGAWTAARHEKYVSLKVLRPENAKNEPRHPKYSARGVTDKHGEWHTRAVTGFLGE